MRESENAGRLKSKVKKIFGIIINVLFFLFFFLCVMLLYLSVSGKKSPDGAVELFGYEMRTVDSSSMEKCALTDVSTYKIKDLSVHTLVFIEKVPEDEQKADEWYAELEIGDVLTFRYVYTTQEVITHRIVEIDAKEDGGYRIVLEGDNKNSEDGILQQEIDTSLSNSPNYVIGKVTGSSKALGLMITAVKSPWGIVLIVIVPCLIIIILEIIQIVTIVSQKKREEREKERKAKDDEIAELKRKLAEANAQLPENDLEGHAE